LEHRLGAIVLSAMPVKSPDPDRVGAAVADVIRRRGLDVLPWSPHATQLRRRLAFLHHHVESWPDMSDQALTESVLQALRVDLRRVRSAAELRRLDVAGSLLSLLDWNQRAALDRLAPTHYVAPTGSSIPIDYTDPDAPKVAIRLQEMFGCRTTPTVLDGRVPVALHLLSPAQRPVQVTRDLAGFWRSSYFDVRKELRARYPKHAWPDDPLSAPPTTRTRRRG
jgi:ATP-dependent helicase HrpB